MKWFWFVQETLDPSEEDALLKSLKAAAGNNSSDGEGEALYPEKEALQLYQKKPISPSEIYLDPYLQHFDRSRAAQQRSQIPK